MKMKLDHINIDLYKITQRNEKQTVHWKGETGRDWKI